MTAVPRPINVLLIEDNPGDVMLIREALSDQKVVNEMTHAPDGETALALLKGEGRHKGRGLPDIILLDLNLPRMSGREVLATLKAEEGLRHIPVVILTSSAAEIDILRSYQLQASCYVTKPLGLDEFINVVQAIEGFWFITAQLPPHP